MLKRGYRLIYLEPAFVFQNAKLKFKATAFDSGFNENYLDQPRPGFCVGGKRSP